MTHKQLIKLGWLIAAVGLVGWFGADAEADPIFGRDRLKFSQKPMIQTQILDQNGVGQDYYGHDELSTAYSFAGQPLWQGRFMADDFGDKITGDVLHVKWWGSYFDDFIDPNMPVDKFLISFESDVPATGPPPSFSHPGQPLLNQVVQRGALAPGSGTFTETPIRGPDPLLGESLYEYNAELHLGKEFFQTKDTVYWLKIVAMVDVAPPVTFDPYNPPPMTTRWGWHNRDYTIFDNEASQNIPIPPFGEYQDGVIGGAGQPIWHFMDDAVRGDVRITPNAAMGIVMPNVDQNNMVPQLYRDFADGPAAGIPGATGIGQHSKDLAFELYTYRVPEPGTCLMFAIGIIGLAFGRRGRMQ